MIIGIHRGLIELRQSFTGFELVGQLLWPVAMLVAVFALRDRNFGTSGYAVGTLALPGVLGMFVALGMFLTLQYLAADREDGTLLRARAVPDGIRGYLVGKFVTVSGTVLAYLVIVGVPGLFVVRGLRAGSVFTAVAVLLLGLVATQAMGAVLGALIAGPRGVSYASLPVMALIGVSGIFYPIAALPGWVRAVAEIFPVYWLGLGMRAALLPAGAAAVEIGGSWRPGETLAVLAAWTVAGVATAPFVLRRMARRESGSRVIERRDRALRRVA